MKTKWYQQKTTWAAIATIIGALAGGFTNTIDWGTAAQTISGALIALFLRQGVAKVGNNESKE